VLRNLRSAFSGLSQEQKGQAAATMFGREAMSGMLAIINSSNEDFNNMATSIANADGATQKMAQTMSGNAQTKIEHMKAKRSTLSVEIGEKLMPAISSLLTFGSKLLNWFSNLNSTTQTIILVFVGLLAAIGPVASVLGGLVTITGVLSGVFSFLAPIITALGLTFAAVTAPIWIVIGVVTALIAIGWTLLANWEAIKAGATMLWTWISNAFNGIKTVIINSLNNAIEFIKTINLFEIGKNIIQGLINGVISMAKSIFNAVVNTVKNAIDGVKNLLGISSPSKLMMQIGIETGKGLAIGLDDTYDSVAQSSLGLAKAVTDGYQNSNQNNTVNSNVTINVRSPAEIYREINFLNRSLAMGL
jgi:phage-related protein